MKKFFLFCLIGLAFVMSGCATNNLSLIQSKIVEKRDAYFVHQDKDAVVSLVTGTREEPYESDGIKGEMVDFAILSFIPSHKLNYATLNYFVLINNIEYEGQLERSDFSAGYVVDLEVLVDSSAIVSVRVFEDDVQIQANLQCVSNDFAVSQSKALEIAMQELSSSLKKYISKKQFSGEIYIKIWKDFSSNSEYFWYVGAVCKNDTFGVLISTATGDVLSVKK